MFLKRSPTVAAVQSPSLTQVSVDTETEKEQCDAIAHWPKGVPTFFQSAIQTGQKALPRVGNTVIEDHMLVYFTDNFYLNLFQDAPTSLSLNFGSQAR